MKDDKPMRWALIAHNPDNGFSLDSGKQNLEENAFILLVGFTLSYIL